MINQEIEGKNENNKIDTNKFIIVIKNELLYYENSFAMAIGVLFILFSTYQITFNHNHYYFLFYGWIIWLVSEAIDLKKKYKNNLPLIIFYEKDLVIKAKIEVLSNYGAISGGYVEIEKDFYKVDTYKTFYSPPFLFGSKNAIEIFKEIDTKYMKMAPKKLWDFSKKVNVAYRFAKLVYFISGIVIHMILFVKYKGNYNILSIVFKEPVKLKAKYGDKDLETPLYLHGISFLVTNKKDFKNIEKIIKSHGGKIKWKLTTIKP